MCALRFLDSFIEKMKFRVEFTVNRIPIRLEHRAVHMAVQHNLKDVLFPVGSREMSPLSPPSLRSVLQSDVQKSSFMLQPIS